MGSGGDRGGEEGGAEGRAKSSRQETKRLAAKMGGLYRDEKLGEGPKGV